MKFTKFKSLVLVPLFALLLAGCTNGGGGNVDPVQKQDPVISIVLEDGKQFNVGEFVEPQITVVPADLEKTVSYSTKNSNLGSTIPNEVGDYKITVTTKENENYKAGSASKEFIIRNVPTLSFYYGDDVALEEGHVFDLDNFPEIYAKSSVAGANITYSYSNASGEALQNKPSTAGVYFITASVARTETIGNTSASISFELVDAHQETPVIKFFYNGEEKCLESNWLDGGFAQSHYNAEDFDITKLSWTVTPASAVYTVSWTLKALDAPEEAEGNPIAAPTTNPLAPGIYSVTITVTNSTVFRWAGFVINDSGQPVDQTTIKFFYNGEEKCLESNWLDEGFRQSHYNAEDFDITKLTWTVTPADAQYTVSWTLKALDAPEEAEGSPIAAPTTNPLAPGIYAVTIAVTNTAVVKWAGFVINDNGSTPPEPQGDPEIKFFYNGEEKCLESKWLDEGFAQSHYDAANFDINKLTWTVSQNAEYTVSWTLKALDAPEEAEGSPINAPTANPLAPGIYTVTISIKDSTIFRWAGFVINDNGEPVPQGDPEIKFFYNGEEKCLESNWLDEGFAQSHYDAANFDINKLTWTVTPVGTNYSVSWTLKALDAPEEAEGSPIAAPTTNPLAPGIYTVTIVVDGGTPFKWAGFVINDNGEPEPQGDPEIKFFYDGQEKCLESNWLDGGFAQSHYDAANFDITKLTWTVSQNAQYSVSWTLKALDAPEEAEGSPIAAPNANPLAPGIYTVTITVNNSAIFRWAGFVINA